MSFTIQDYHDLVDLIGRNPQWRAELRQLLLTEEVLELPATVNRLAATVCELAEEQKRTEARLDTLTARVEDLTVRLDALTVRVEDLTVRVDTLTARVAELAEAQKRTEARLEELVIITSALAADQKKIWNKLSQLDGRTLEAEFRHKAPAYFGPLLKRLRLVELPALEDQLEAQLTEDEMAELWPLDLLLTGRLRRVPEQSEVWLAVEVSAVVDRQDVARARRGADLLSKAGYPALPVAAGDKVTAGARQAAREQGVALLQDGGRLLWDEVVSAWRR